VGFTQIGRGATATTVQAKLRQYVNVEDFGGNGDGVTDDSPALAAALSAACPGKGVAFSNKLYLASSITIPPNCSLRGPLDNVGEQASGNYNVPGAILLPGTATISISQGSSLSGAYVLNSAIANSLPFRDITTAMKAVDAFSGTAITAIGSDVHVHDVWIGGFSQAFYSSRKERTKMERVQIDSTNGVWVDYSTDIARIVDVHAWPFLTTHRTWSTGQSARRKGSAFKVTGHFDTGMLINDFAFGYDVGFDIQAKETVNLLNCFADGPSLGVGQVGFKLTQTADLVSMIGGGASGQDIGVYINIPAMPTAGSISISGAQFWGNYAHVISDQHKALNITASYFRDNNGGMRKGVSINDGVTGITNVSSSIFDGPGNPISIATGAPLRSATVLGNSYVNAAAYPETVRGLSNSGTTDDASHLLGATWGSPAAIGRDVPNAAAFSSLSIGSKHVQASAVSRTPDMSIVGSNLTLQTWKDVTASSWLSLSHSRSSSVGTHGAVQANDMLGGLSFEGSDGTAFRSSAQIAAYATGTPSGTHIPTEVRFASDNGISFAARMRIDGNGNLVPAGDNLYSLGASTQRWSNLYAAKAHATSVAATGPILSSGATGGVGYMEGAGGVATQAISKTTGVTLNTVAGQITMNSAQLAASASACFMLNNSVISAYDTISRSIASGATAGAYSLDVDAVGSGTARFCLHNHSGASLSETPVINFAVIKGAAN